MRITTYSVRLDSDRKNALVKDNSRNCPEISSLNSPDKVANMLNGLFDAKHQAEEHLWMIALNTKLHTIGVFEVSHGTVNYSVITPREIFVRLCLCGASSFILAHNHPSGDVSPSKDDVSATERILKAGELMDIKLLDHVIIGEGFYSFHKEKII